MPTTDKYISYKFWYKDGIDQRFHEDRQQDIYWALTEKAKKRVYGFSDGQLLTLQDQAQNFSEDFLDTIINSIQREVNQTLDTSFENAIAAIKEGINSYFHSTVKEWKTFNQDNYMQAYYQLNDLIESAKRSKTVSISANDLNRLYQDLNPQNFRKKSFRLRQNLGKIAELESMLRMYTMSNNLLEQMVKDFNSIPNLSISIEKDFKENSDNTEHYTGENFMMIRSKNQTIFSLKLANQLKSSIQNPKKKNSIRIIKSTIQNVLADKPYDYREEVYNAMSYHWPLDARKREPYLKDISLLRQTLGGELLSQYYDTIFGGDDFFDSINLILHQGKLKTGDTIIKSQRERTKRYFNAATIGGDNRSSWAPSPVGHSIFYYKYKTSGEYAATLDVQRRIAAFTLTYQTSLGDLFS